MTTDEPQSPQTVRREKLYRAVVFVLLVLTAYTFPRPPALDLDASWRMALGKFLIDGLQFGHDVVFTYGPLGFLMGKTYYGSGVLFRGILAWQAFAAVVFSLVIMLWGERLEGRPRLWYYGFFLFFGVYYEDALHMFVIVLVGAELIRRNGTPGRWSSVLMLLLLALMSVIKFTNLVLCLIVVLVAALHAAWLRERGTAVRLVAWFAGAFLACWVASWQNPLNLPAYFRNSWIVSQGYQEAMGISTPTGAFWKAMAVIVLLGVYFVHYLATHRDRPRALAYCAALGAFLYLNWKHGFVRSDGHMIGFFFCAALPLVLHPVLLNDHQNSRWLQRLVLLPTGALCLLGVYDALPGLVEFNLAQFQGKVWGNVHNFVHLSVLRDGYNDRLNEQRQGLDMPRTRALIGEHSIDVIGYDQGGALFNRFNYVPRPVFQSYSAYTPELARLNAAYYASDQAPDFVMMRMQSIDDRMPGMDDAPTLYLISHRYTYRLTEKSYQVWQKNPGPFDAAAIAPKPLARTTVRAGEPWLVAPYNKDRLWLTVDLRPSLLGRLRNFLYKPPFVYLAVEDTAGNSSTYRMPAPLGRAGFVLSPLIEDLMGFVNFAGGTPERTARQVRIHIAPEDLKYFANDITLELSALTPATGGRNFFDMVNTERFHLFKQVPVAFDAQAPPSEETIDGKPVMVMHAPSEMTFNLDRTATEINGKLGFLAGAYTRGGRTNGADFSITWSDGKSEIALYHRFLDPLNRPDDRGLQSFHVDLKNLVGGRLYFRVGAGPYNDHGWDWTAWTDIEIK